MQKIQCPAPDQSYQAKKKEDVTHYSEKNQPTECYKSTEAFLEITERLKLVDS